MRNLNKIFGVVIVLFFSFCFSISCAQTTENSEKTKLLLVLSDRVEQANPKYFIYPQVSEMIAAEIINKLNTEGEVKAPTLSYVRSELRAPALVRASYVLLDNYRYTYDINYAALRKIANHFDTTNVLIVTGAMDTTSDFLKPTWWSRLNVPGENVVKSEFKLYTYIALVDLNTETIKWQNAYERNLEAPEFGLVNLNYSPDAKQMVKVKQGSQLIAKDAAYRVESVLTPLIAAEKTPPTVHEFLKFHVNKKYEESVQNINDIKTKTVEKIKSLNSQEKQVDEAVGKRIEISETVVETDVEAVQEDVVIPQEKKETGLILKFVKSKKDKKLKKKNLDETVKVVVEEKAIQLEPVNELPDAGLRPAIDIDKNIQINPINIIIPKM